MKTLQQLTLALALMLISNQAFAQGGSHTDLVSNDSTPEVLVVLDHNYDDEKVAGELSKIVTQRGYTLASHEQIRSSTKPIYVLSMMKGDCVEETIRALIEYKKRATSPFLVRDVCSPVIGLFKGVRDYWSDTGFEIKAGEPVLVQNAPLVVKSPRTFEVIHAPEEGFFTPSEWFVELLQMFPKPNELNLN